METIPQAMPNMVRKARSLCDQRVRTTSKMRSRRVIPLVGRSREGNVIPGVSRSRYESRRVFVSEKTSKQGFSAVISRGRYLEAERGHGILCSGMPAREQARTQIPRFARDDT